MRQAHETSLQGDDARRGIVRSTAIVLVMTALSRIAGLAREVLASSYFGTSGRFSAFTVAFQLPSLLRSLLADSALSAAFVPVFSELIEQGRKREALQLAFTLLWGIALIFAAATCVFILSAGAIMPLFLGPTFGPALVHLTVGLARVLFPTVLLLGVNGVLVGVLQVYGRFGLPAFGGLAWNLVIVAVLVVLRPHFHGVEQLYAYAIGVLAGTVAQLSIAVAAVRGMGLRLTVRVDWRNSRIRQVLILMLPVTIALGIVEVDSLINVVFGTLVSDQAPRAIEAAFRIYMLPQGLVSIPVTTVLFPTMSRLAARGEAGELRRLVDVGLRQLSLLMIPAAALILALASPVVRLIYQRGAFDAHSTELVARGLVWFAVSLPFAAANLLLTRTFFAIQRPWVAGRVAAVNLLVDIAVSAALYKPLGIAGLVLGTAAGSALMLVMQLRLLSRELEIGQQAERTLGSLARMSVAAVLLGVVSWSVSLALHSVLGESLPAQIATVGFAVGAGLATYTTAVMTMRIPEAYDAGRALADKLRGA